MSETGKEPQNKKPETAKPVNGSSQKSLLNDQGFDDQGPNLSQGSALGMMEPPSVNRVKEFSPQESKIAKNLLQVLTKEYKPVTPLYGLRTLLGVLDYNQPIFSRMWIPAMQQDPHLIYGFRMLNAPVKTKAKFTVTADNPAVQDFVDKQIKRFWKYGLTYSLAALEYGYVGCEVLYRFNKQTRCIEFDKLKFIHPNDVKPVIVKGQLKGMDVRRIHPEKQAEEDKYIGLPKMVWFVHDKKSHRWYGRSRYAGAFIPWYEYWQPKGFRALRHLIFYKYSFRGPNIGYPEGAVQDSQGNQIPNVRIAEEMADRAEAGATMIYPTINQEYGGWEIGDPFVMNIPDALLEYGDDLKKEKWEGIGLPPEVVDSDAGAAGSFSGKRIPQEAFLSDEDGIALEQYSDFDEQALRYLVDLNFGPEEQYEVEQIPISVAYQQEQMAQVTGHMPGDPSDGFYEQAGLTDGEPGMDEGEEEGGLSMLSNGRIEDRKNNPYNKKEKAAVKSKGKK